MNILLSAVFSIGMLIFSASCLAQYTYIEAGLNNTNLMYNSTAYTKTSTYTQNINFRLSVVSRIIRNFGIGAEFNLPLWKKFNSSFKDSHTPDGSHFFGFEDRYAPQKFDYSIESSISGAVFGRLYLSTTANPYFDIKCSFIKVTEHFIFRRAEVPSQGQGFNYKEGIPEVNINRETEYQMAVAGFTFGLQPHIGKHIFLNFNIGLDLYNFGKSNAYSYDIPHDWSTLYDAHSIVKLENYARNTRGAFSFHLGAGYFF